MTTRSSYESLFRNDNVDRVLKGVQRVGVTDELDREGASLLGMAAYYGHFHAVRWLLAEGAGVDVRDSQKQTPLMQAIMAISTERTIGGRRQIMDVLIDKGADINGCDRDGRSVLNYAAQAGRYAPDLLIKLVSKGAVVETRDQWGRTPLMLAAGCGDVKGARLLVAHGAVLEARDGQGCTAIFYAVHDPGEDSERKGGKTLAREWLKAGVNLQIQNSKTGETLLKSAVSSGMDFLIQSCLAAGSKVNAQDHHGVTALHVAVLLKNVSAIKALIRAGGDVHIKDKSGRTPADMSRHVEILRLLQ